MTYRLLSDPSGSGARADVIQRVADGACIPNDPENRDWQAYLAWLAEKNVPAPPEELAR